MKSNCEDYSEEELAVSMKFACLGGPNISQEAHKWLEQAKVELINQEKQLAMLLEVCAKLCQSAEGYSSIDKIRHTYIDMCVSSGGDAEHVKEQVMWYLPDEGFCFACLESRSLLQCLLDEAEEEEEEEEDKHKCGRFGGIIPGMEGCGKFFDMEDTNMIHNTSFCIACYEKFEEQGFI